MDEIVLRWTCGVLRLFFRLWPFGYGKQQLWDWVVRPHLAWRPISVVSRTRFGMLLPGRIDNLIDRYLYFFGVWEPGLSAVMKWHLRPGDRVIDIGANVGAHSLYAATLVQGTGQVIAIEASPSIFQRLSDNVARNGVGQVHPLNAAVTDRSGPVTVYLNAADNLGATTTVAHEAAQRGAATEAQVDGHPLGSLVPMEQIIQTRLIKIDVEGAEWQVLTGMRPLLSQLHEECIILVEVLPDAQTGTGNVLDQMVAMMRDAGFEALEVVNTYHPGFYLAPPTTMIRSLAPPWPEALDLLFARPSLLARLLASDLAGGGPSAEAIISPRPGAPGGDLAAPPPEARRPVLGKPAG